ncbi:MAG: M23 family metallopeptidase [Spirochaetaceae bacterium]|nr:MAG: M23 family metallopeptidase [Spirochaetaceae bacterium]
MKFLIALVVVSVVLSCGREIVEEEFAPVDTHDRYVDALIRLDLHETQMGRDWISAARAALDSPSVVSTPIEETVLFDPHEPAAIGYRFAAEQGRRITISVDTDVERYFADVFRAPASSEGTPEPVASRPESGAGIEFEPRRDAEYLLRIQPELLRGGRFVVSITAHASLTFPVQGVGPERILSFFGDARDGGARMHEGIDIFAPRGTPLLAASDSTVIRVGVRDRGGNIVTLRDDARDLLLYYAHLDEQLVRQGQRVRAGDPVGTTGNTGNAVTTPPHLHIGVYQGSWARSVDPWNYFVDPPATVPTESVAADRVGEWMRLSLSASVTTSVPGTTVTPRFVNRNPLLRNRPGPVDASGAGEPPDEPGGLSFALPAGEAVRAIGAIGDHVRIRTTDGRTGFVPAVALSDQSDPIGVDATQSAYDPRTGDAVAALKPGASVELIGSAGERARLVRLPGGRVALLN